MSQNKFRHTFFLNLDFFNPQKELAVIFLIFSDVSFNYLVVTQDVKGVESG